MPRITVLQLDPEVPLDRFEGWLGGAGASVDLVSVPESGTPALAEVGQGLLVLGGRMNAHAVREHSWLPHVAGLLVDAVQADVPVLAICLGHQILADAFGGEVTVAHPGGGESGPVEITWARAAYDDPLLGSVASAGRLQPEAHYDAVTRLPAAAEGLASSSSYPHQAFRIGSAVGVQFHPEASPGLVGRWRELSGKAPEPTVSALRHVDHEVVTVGRALAESFVRVCRG